MCPITAPVMQQWRGFLRLVCGLCVGTMGAGSSPIGARVPGPAGVRRRVRPAPTC